MTRGGEINPATPFKFGEDDFSYNSPEPVNEVVSEECLGSPLICEEEDEDED